MTFEYKFWDTRYDFFSINRMTYILIIEKGTTNAMAVFMIIKCKEFDLIGMQL